MHTIRGTSVRRRQPDLGAALAALLLPVVLTACGGSTQAGSSTTTSTSGTSSSTSSAPTSSTVPTTSPTSTTLPATTTTTTSVTLATVPMQTPTGGEFLSPSGNISCEVDYHHAGLTQAYCQTLTPPQSVRLTASGTVVTRCSGSQCLSNHGLDIPTLYYGEATGVGPYRCTSASTGITCTANGKGFRISKSGITPVTTP